MKTEKQVSLWSTIDLLTSVMRIPGISTGTGSNFVPGETFSTARTKPTAPRLLAVSETFFTDALPIMKLKEYPQRRMLPSTIFLFRTSGLWQSEGLYLKLEESSIMSFAATRLYVRFQFVAAAMSHENILQKDKGMLRSWEVKMIIIVKNGSF